MKKLKAENKLWQSKNLKSDSETRVLKFTTANDKIYDLLLVPFDILGSIAHAKMLCDVGLLSKNEFKKIHLELKKLYKLASTNKFKIDKNVEDVHSAVEIILTSKIGEAGKKLHTGRSRNDQALLDICLYLRSETKNIVALSQILFNQLIALSEKNKNVFLPGYTHLQVAMPSSFGLWFASFAESLIDDLNLFHAAYYSIDKNPLGSAAGFGSSFPISREKTTNYLGFSQIRVNSANAQLSRGKIEKTFAVALSGLAFTLSKFSMDVTLYLSQNFGFLSLPNDLTTGSSIMPHKKNPDLFELVRAKCNRVIATPNELSLLINNLPSGYHRDFQLSKEIIFPAISSMKEVLDILNFVLPKLIVNKNISSDERYKYIYSVEAINELVKDGISFRDAYRLVADKISSGGFLPKTKSKQTHIGSVDNLSNHLLVNEFKNKIKQFNFDRAENALKKLLG